MIREKLFMIDIEATGVDLHRDEILEIGIVEMLPDTGGRYVAGAQFHRFVYSDRLPTSEFAKTHMAEIYRQANETPWASSTEIRVEILHFLRKCGRTGHDVLFCGWNASNFDLPMMHQSGFLEAPGYRTVNGKDQQVGDHHYRVYEMCGALQLVCDARQLPYDVVKSLADEFVMALPEGKEHDAIYDCFKQIKLLNGLIQLVQKGSK